MKHYHVYIMTNQSRTLYVGVTNDLEHRVLQHRSKSIPGFTAKYNITNLAWYEEFTSIREAIEREKRLKGWTRAKKLALIEEMNPRWKDLAADWFTQGQLST
jgi:putative endonuclease